MRIEPSSEPAGLAELALLGRQAEAVGRRLEAQRAWALRAAATPSVATSVARGSLLPVTAVLAAAFLFLV